MKFSVKGKVTAVLLLAMTHLMSANTASRGKRGVVSPDNTMTRPAPLDYRHVHGVGYYKVYRDLVAWETARRRCASEGAHLLVINNDVEAATVMRPSGISGWFWMGFEDFDAEGEFVTVQGQTLHQAGYAKWAQQEPTEGLHCGVAKDDGLLGSGNCTITREFICEFEVESPPPVVGDPEHPNGYRRYGELGFYKVHRGRVKWETARRRCEAEGAHLAIVNSQEEADAVLKTSGLSEWFYLGFDDYDTDRQYITVLGVPLAETGYLRWAPAEPTNDVHCGVARGDGLLGTGRCWYKREYICELYKPGEKPGHKPQAALSPPVGYLHPGKGGYYKMHRDKVPWETARRRCQLEGAHLVIVNSQSEADAVLRNNGFYGWFWVGFDDFDAEGDYMTVEGKRLRNAGYLRWAEDEPTADLNCGVARPDGLLGTGSCQLTRGYICEWTNPFDLLKPPTPDRSDDYRSIGNLGVYKVHFDRVKWETARRRCEAEGAHLVVVNSQAEADAVLKTCELPSWFWVGFDDFDQPGRYVTALGTTIQEAGFERWASDEPTAWLHCGVARTDGLLGTGNCLLSRGYICEKKVSPSGK